MRFFCRLPWLNILFPEATIMKVRARFRDDGATRYEDVESGLNRMTVGRFERIVASSALQIEMRDYRCVRNINALAGIPYLRELFINNVSVILSKART